MRVERLERSEVRAASVESLQLDSSWIDLTDAESIAACLRRAASFRCPTTPRALLTALCDVLDGLTDLSDTIDQIEEILDRLTSYGDLLELEVESTNGVRRELFLGPPSYVLRSSGACLLMGIRPDGAPLLTTELEELVEHDAHIRRLSPRSNGLLSGQLDDEGLAQRSMDQWLHAPRQARPEELLQAYITRLDAATEVADVEGLRLIDTGTPVTYYRGRWRPRRPNDRGIFVARRPQAFGSDLWCLVAISAESMKLIDLPLGSDIGRGCDVAWRIQAANDVMAGRPQRMAVTTGQSEKERVLQIFSPVPSWIQRRLDAVGRPLGKVKGALFAYAIAVDEMEEEVRFLQQMMWLEG